MSLNETQVQTETLATTSPSPARSNRAPICPGPTREAAHQLFLAGQRPIEIQKRLAINATTVRQWIKRYGWDRERDQVIDRSTKAVVSTVERVTNDAIAQHTQSINRVVKAKIVSLEKLPAKTSLQLAQQAKALKGFDDVGRRNLGLDLDGKHQPFSSTINLNLGTYEPKKVVEIQAETRDVDEHEKSETVIENGV